jgi:hypothetical protein
MHSNRAAFSRDDIEDAKRGCPDLDLRDYAARRGLEFLDHATPAGFRAALPCDEGRQSNVLRGVLPGGEYGVVAHEALEIGYSADSFDWGGTYYGIRVTAKGEGFKWHDILDLIPFLSALNWFGATATATVRVPCTVVGVRVPETVAIQPCLRIDTRRSAPPYSFGKRIEVAELVGAADWAAYPAPAPEPGFLERLLAEPVAGILRSHSGEGLFQAIVLSGTLLVRRNGFLGPDGIDELARAASLIAARLREVCRPPEGAQPFDRPLPGPAWDVSRPNDMWCRWALDTADRYGLELEDTAAYHRAFPSLPVPGAAHVVMRGAIPHVGEGRLVVHRERDAARPALLIAAPEGAEPTPPGGLRCGEHGARLEIAGGLLAVWSTTSWNGDAMVGDLDAFLATAAAAIDATRRVAVS